MKKIPTPQIHHSLKLLLMQTKVSDIFEFCNHARWGSVIPLELLIRFEPKT